MKKIIGIAFALLLGTARAGTFSQETLLRDKDVIWGFDFLADGKVIYTTRSGRLQLFDVASKKNMQISGAPAVYAVGQGGLLDVRVHPRTGFIYVSYSEPKGGDKSATVLARFKLGSGKVTEFKKIFEADANGNPYHYGSRIEFLEDKVFLSSGERGDRPQVQNPKSFVGKIIRMNEDGSGAEVWCRGLRNPQGLTVRPGTTELWEAEMGPQGGDEVNVIKRGANYGWAVVTYGEEYGGGKIGEGTAKAGMEPPFLYWVPSISPSALTFWRGDLWLGTLSGEHLRRIVLKDAKVVTQEVHFKELGQRFRNVRPGPDGALWYSTDEGALGRVLPAK
jgi:glucose/arabinose dehydrogenase